MIKIIITISAFLISTLLLAQVSEKREVTTFSKLQASQGIEVFYTISNTISVNVETDDLELLKYIKTEVENNVLKLYIDSKGYKTKNTKLKVLSKNKTLSINGINFNSLKILVSGPNLESIKASSAADIKIENLNTTTYLDITVSSAGSISGAFDCLNAVVDASSSGEFLATINATTIQIESSSASDVVLSGKAKKTIINASSAADCNLKELVVEDAKIKASSSSDVVVTVMKSINSKASSSADISFYGNPTQIEKEESSLGSISKK
jgi:hypothetical protein